MTGGATPQIMALYARYAKDVARLHRLGLPRAFLSRLGDRFLAQLYLAISNVPESGVWIALADEERCLGFIAGSRHIGRCYRDVLMRRGLQLLWTALPALASKQSVVFALETLRYPFLRRRQSEPTGQAPIAADSDQGIQAELLAIAVDESAQGLGLGRSLVLTFEDGLRAWGHTGPYRVVTESEDPHSNAFYRRVGFVLEREILHHGHRMSVYWKQPEV